MLEGENMASNLIAAEEKYIVSEWYCHANRDNRGRLPV